MLFGLDGVELSLIIVFSTLFLSILSGYPVAFGLSGAAVVSFAIIALLNEWGLKYNKALVCPENNSYGYATILKLQELKYPRLYYRRRKTNVLIKRK